MANIISVDWHWRMCKAVSLKGSLIWQVPYMVAICMRRQALPAKVMPEWEEMCAVASAVQNMWLAATAHGIAGKHYRSHAQTLASCCEVRSQ